VNPAQCGRLFRRQPAQPEAAGIAVGATRASLAAAPVAEPRDAIAERILPDIREHLQTGESPGADVNPVTGILHHPAHLIRAWVKR